MNSQEFSKDMCRSMVAMLDADHSGKLGLNEFKTLLNDIAKWKVSISIFQIAAKCILTMKIINSRRYSSFTTTTVQTS